MAKLGHDIKIVVASPSLNLLGGAQRACLQAIAALRKINSKVVLATVDKTDWSLVKTIFGDVPEPDEEIYLFSRMPSLSVLAFKQAFVAFSYALHLSLVKQRYGTALIVNMGGELVDNIGDVVYVNAVPLRLMHRIHDVQPLPGFQWTVYSRLYTLLLRVIGGSTGVVVANSRFTQMVIDRFMHKKAVLIYPPVAVDEIATDIDRKRANTVVSMSRFRLAKKVSIIPEIASHVKDCTFIIAGIADADSGRCLRELFGEIRRLGVEDRVKVYLNMPYESTRALLLRAKVFLHTQSTEAFGMAIVEAMAAGCVPVVPRAGGPWIDIFDCCDGEYGFSYTKIEEAAERINLLLSNNRLRSKIAEKARQRATVFDESIFEQKILQVISSNYSL